MKKCFISLVAFVASVVSAAAPSVWDGSADTSWFTANAKSYTIKSAEQLAGLAKLVNNGTANFDDITIYLGANIFLNDTTGAGDGSWYEQKHRQWIPIGTKTHPFKGNLQGDVIIYGLYINTQENYQGLVGYAGYTKVSAGSFRTGRVSNIDLRVLNVTGGDYVGAFAGYKEKTSSFVNCHASGRVAGAHVVGGIAGSGKFSLTDVSFTGDVSGISYVGGIVGISKAISAETAIIGVKNVFHLGNTSAEEGYVGGLFGTMSYTAIKNSYSIGDVTSDGDYVGGLIGTSFNASLDSVYTEGRVVGENYVGGVVGDASAGTSYDKNLATNMTAVIHQKGDVVGNGHVGGIAGGHGGYYPNNARPAIKSVSVSSKVIGRGDYVGGLFGGGPYIDSSSFVGDSVVGQNYVGGAIGYVQYATSYDRNEVSVMTNVKGGSFVGGVYGSGNARGTFFEGNVFGVRNVGGIVGRSAELSKENYFKGSVWGEDSAVGGIVGSSAKSGTLIACDNVAQGIVTGNNSVGGLVGSGRTSRSTFVGTVKGRNRVGGLSGAGQVDSCKFIGDVVGNDSVGGALGVGSNLSSGIAVSYSSVKASVLGVSNVGGITGNGSAFEVTFEGLVKGDGNYVGGISGNGGTVRKALVRSNVFGNDLVGGIVGIGTVRQSYFLGDSVIGNDNVGGIAGRSLSIDTAFSMATVVGHNYVGGMSGDGGQAKHVRVQGDVYGVSSVGGVCGSMRVGKTNLVYFIGTLNTLAPREGEKNVTVGGFAGSASGDSIQSSYVSVIINDEKYPVTSNKGCAFGTQSKISFSGFVFNKDICTDATSLRYLGWREMNIYGGIDGDKYRWLKFEDRLPELSLFEKSFLTAFVKVEDVSKIYYDGLSKTPGVTSVMYRGVELTKGVDFDVSYSNNINAGIATMKICGKGAFKGCQESYFEIKPREIKPLVKLGPYASTYDGFAKMPSVQVYDGDYELSDADYEIFVKNNIRAGTATIGVTLFGNYTGSASVDFEISEQLYVIRFIGFSGETLQEDLLAYGTMPSYSGENVDRESSAQYRYEFVGWSPEIKPVRKSVNYKAVFNSVLKEYVVTFMDSENVLQSSSWKYGEKPVYEGMIPVRTPTELYSYEFVGWSPRVTEVSENAVYKALFDSTEIENLKSSSSMAMSSGAEEISSSSVVESSSSEKESSSSETKESSSSSQSEPLDSSSSEPSSSSIALSSSVEENSSSSVVESSSSEKESSSSEAKESSSSSQSEPLDSSSSEPSSSSTTVVSNTYKGNLRLSVQGMTLTIANAEGNVSVFDALGHVVAVSRVSAMHPINVTLSKRGSYIVKVGSLIRRVNVK